MSVIQYNAITKSRVNETERGLAYQFATASFTIDYKN
jgi:hypothetical protein